MARRRDQLKFKDAGAIPFNARCSILHAFEESLLLVLRLMIPLEVKVILLADRGFGRTELARFCQKHGFSYVIRIQPKVYVNCASYKGKLIDYPVQKGICKLLRSVAYRGLSRRCASPLPW